MIPRISALAIVVIAITVLLAGPSKTYADPPAKPVVLTTAQFEYLRQLEAQPNHTALLDIQATYKSEREKSLDFTRASDDFWTAAVNGGFPAIIILLLIAGAPL